VRSAEYFGLAVKLAQTEYFLPKLPAKNTYTRQQMMSLFRNPQSAIRNFIGVYPESWLFI